jgi:repressor of nif and glnA expression
MGEGLLADKVARVKEEIGMTPETEYILDFIKDTEKRGFIRSSYYADLVIVEKGETPITHDSILYKCGWSPLEGQTLHTRIRQVFLNGMPANQSTAMKLSFDK